jgi:hypothetical protein
MIVRWTSVPRERGTLCTDTPLGHYVVRRYIKGDSPFVLLINGIENCLFSDKADAVQAVENQFAGW